MDGNGRWAKKQGKLRMFGHENGTKSVTETVEAVAELGISHLTLYAFSTENWSRPKIEVQTLMKLLIKSLKKEIKTLQKNNIRLNAIGNLNALPNKVLTELNDVIDKTKNNSRVVLTLALSYGSREEIISAIKEISKLRIDGESRMVVGKPKTCNGVSRYKQPPTKNGVNTAKVMEMELNAVLAILNKDSSAAEKWLKKATALESETSFSYGPPDIVKPSHEFYGEWLLENNKIDEAKKQFENQLERSPKRLLAEKGLKKSTT